MRQDLNGYWRDWCQTQLSAQPLWLRRQVAALPEPDRFRWVMRLRNPRSPWLDVVLERFGRWREAWVVVSGLVWEVAETETVTFLCYPEALGSDPLALMGIGLVWAAGHERRERMVAERLGPLLAPAALAAQGPPWAAAWWAAYRQAYGGVLAGGVWPAVERWLSEQGADRAEATTVPTVRWRPWPAQVDRYREQLAFGMVPHEPGGAPPADADAVLLAGLALRQAEGAAAGGATMALVGKALEAVSLYARWRAAADSREREGR